MRTFCDSCSSDILDMPLGDRVTQVLQGLLRTSGEKVRGQRCTMCGGEIDADALPASLSAHRVETRAVHQHAG